MTIVMYGIVICMANMANRKIGYSLPLLCIAISVSDVIRE